MAPTPAAATFSLSSKITRSARRLPIPGIAVRRAWSPSMIASWRSVTGRLPVIARATFGPTPVTDRRRLKKPSSSGVRKP